MQRVVHPPVDQFDQLRRPMQPGERLVFEFFDRHLYPDWEIYVEPHLNGLRPDFVLLHPQVGIAVYEVKDWRLDRMNRFVAPDRDGIPTLYGERFRERNPVEQVNRYKRKLFDLYCPRLDQRLGLAAITAGVIFPEEDGARVAALLAPFVDGPAVYQPVSGRGELAAGDLAAVFPTAKYSWSKLMSEEIAADLRGWLVEPDFSREQRRPLRLDDAQRKLATTRTTTGYRRIKGPAGSGKSLVLAARAAALADAGKSVRIVCFNITLRNYLHDLVVRAVKEPGAGRNIVIDHFHGWCRDMCELADMEQRLNDVYASLPKPTPNATPAERKLLAQQRIDAQRYLDENSLPGLAAEAVRKAVELKRLEPSDAVLVDEGQDFRPSWWNALRASLKEGGEMMLVADATQDIYGTARSWTDEAMTGAGFAGGRWAQLEVSYRLPARALIAANTFARRFLPSDMADLPLPRQQSFDEIDDGRCTLCWVQCTPEEALDRCTGAVIAMMKETGRDGLANADIVILTEGVAFGAALVDRLRSREIETRSTFAPLNAERRREKFAFWKGSERIKATTLHSFKGWESRLLVVYVDQAFSADSLALVYVALTRLKASADGSWLTVVCSAPELADYGRTWAEPT